MRVQLLELPVCPQNACSTRNVRLRAWIPLVAIMRRYIRDYRGYLNLLFCSLASFGNSCHSWTTQSFPGATPQTQIRRWVVLAQDQLRNSGFLPFRIELNIRRFKVSCLPAMCSSFLSSAIEQMLSASSVLTVSSSCWLS